MKPIWKGSISFGLINIPVKIFSAIQDSSLDLDMLDSRDHSNIKFKRVNENTGKEVDYEKIVKGYKLKDDYVILEPEDFAQADVVKTKTIEILSFADQQEIDSIYYEQPYYLEPDKSGAKAYAIFRDALAASGRVGVTSFVMRNRESLAILKPYKNVIVLNKIRFQEEIRDSDDLNVPATTPARSKEKEMAKKLIDSLTEKFDIKSFKDTYTQNLLKIIKDKSKGKKPKKTKMRVVHTKQDDLMEMLKASLSDKKKKKKAS